VLIDATYNTSKYDLAVFFLSVQTNMGYVNVAMFAVEHETTAAIADALTVIKGWNPTWTPMHFITDYCEAEIAACEDIFPGDL